MTAELNEPLTNGATTGPRPVSAPDDAPAETTGQRRGSRLPGIERDRPGVVAQVSRTTEILAAHEDSLDKKSEPDSETITEVAPDTEKEPPRHPEVGPDHPHKHPEIAPPYPDKPPHTEVAPEPEEPDPDRVIPEIAPDEPERHPELAPHYPDEPPRTEVAPDSPDEPYPLTEVVPEVGPEKDPGRPPIQEVAPETERPEQETGPETVVEVAPESPERE
ncbi:MAG TPA: hypothetical protein VEF72_12365 [Mycobacterium sp.]|nr:hypothetical protein [Mycobacterium sp.]